MKRESIISRQLSLVEIANEHSLSQFLKLFLMNFDEIRIDRRTTPWHQQELVLENKKVTLLIC